MSEAIKPAIIAVGYNRPHCLERLLKSIGNACYQQNDITLIISLDKAENNQDVKRIAESFQWHYGNKIIREFPERQGLKKHIIACGDYTEKYDSVIVLEDDIVVSEDYYNYACSALDYYSDEKKVVGPALYSFMKNPYANQSFIPVYNGYDNYFAQYVITWGQCWKREIWKSFKGWLSKHDTLPDYNPYIPKEVLAWKRAWSKYFVSFMVENDLFYAVPYHSLSTNFSEKGEHQAGDSYETAYQVPLSSGHKKYVFAPFSEGIKYNSFMERVLSSSETIEGIPGDKILFDLYGTRQQNIGNEYLLTIKKFPFEVIRTYGMRMHPVDLNIQFNVPGEGIYLYKVQGNEELINKKDRKPGYYKLDLIRGKYETWGMTWRQLFLISIFLLKEKVISKIRK